MGEEFAMNDSNCLKILTITALVVGCQGPLSPNAFDFDGDDVVDAEDCAPANPDVWELDQDADGWQNADCTFDVRPALNDQTSGQTGQLDVRNLRCDCDDNDETVHPGGPDVNPLREPYLTVACPEEGEAIEPWETLAAAQAYCAEEGVVPDWVTDEGDNDCSSVDESLDDVDGDGVIREARTTSASDCDDCRADIHPGVIEDPALDEGECPDPALAYDMEDENCDDVIEMDYDNDGFDATGWGALHCGYLYPSYTPSTELDGEGDCDDLNADVNPLAAERCDGVDQDCDGDPIRSANAEYDFDIADGVLYLEVSPGATDGQGSPAHPFGTIDEAMDALEACQAAASAEDLDVVIRLSAGVHLGSSRSVGYDVGEWADVTTVEIVGDPGGDTTLQPDGHPALQADFGASQELIVRDLTISGSGVLGESGLVVSGGSLTLQDISFEDLQAIEGAAVRADSLVRASLDDVVAIRCEATGSGGALWLSGDEIVLTNSTLSSDSADDDGGAAYLRAEDEVVVSGVEMVGDSAGSLGGALWVDAGDITIEVSRLSGNTATTYGGAGYLAGDGIADISSSEFRGNTSQYGGALYLRGSYQVDASTFSSNHAEILGGALASYDYNSIDISGSTFSQNDAEAGGAVYGCFWGQMTLEEGTRFSDNVATRGGAIFGCGGGVFVSSEVSFTSNTSSEQGGGLYLNSTTQAEIGADTLFTGNDTGSGQGGGAYLYGTAYYVKVDGASFESNQAGSGGGLYLHGTGSFVDLADTAFQDNRASIGGGLYLSSAYDVTIRSSRLDSNTATMYGGAICARGGSLTLDGVRLYDNEASTGGGAIYSALGSLQASYVVIAGNRGGDILGAEGTTYTLAHLIADAGSDGGTYLGYGLTHVSYSTFFDESGGAMFHGGGLHTFASYNVFARGEEAGYEGGNANHHLTCNLFYGNADDLSIDADATVDETGTITGIDPGFASATADGDPTNETYSSFEVTSADALTAMATCADPPVDQVGALGGDADWDAHFPTAFWTFP